MNLVHRVGVVFHAHDRLSHRLKKMGENMLGLEKRKTSLDKSLAGLAAQEARFAKMQERSATSALQAGIQQKAMNNALMRQKQGLAKLQENLAAKELADVRKHADLRTSLANAHSALEQKHSDIRKASRAKDAAAQTALIKKQTAEYDTYNRKLEANANKRAKLERGGAQLIDSPAVHQTLANEVAAREARKQALITERDRAVQAALFNPDGTTRHGIRKAEAERILVTTRSGQVRAPGDSVSTGRAMTPLEMAHAEAEAAMRSGQKQIGQLTAIGKEDAKRLADHQKLVDLQHEEAQLTARRDAASQDFTRTMQTMHAEQQRAREAERAAHQQLENAKRSGDEEELARSRRNYEEKQAHNEKLLRQQGEHVQAQADLARDRNGLLEHEGEIRKRNLELAHQELQQAHAAHEAEDRLQRKMHRRQRLVGAASAGAGGFVAGGLASYGLARGIAHIAEAGGKRGLLAEQLQGMGMANNVVKNGKLVRTGELDKILAINNQQSRDVVGVSFADSVETFKLLHTLLGGPEGVLGEGLKDTSILTKVNKFKTAAGLTYGLKEKGVEDLLKAAEGTSSSDQFRMVKGKPKLVRLSHEERIEHFNSQLELMFKAVGVMGKKLNPGEILAMTKTMQASKFGLKGDAFLRASFVAQELGGGRTGTAINSFLTNIGTGSQSSKKNQMLAEMGLLDLKSKAVERNPKTGAITGYLPTALKNGAQAFADPIQWMGTTFSDAIQKKLGKTPMNEKTIQPFIGPLVTALTMKGVGRQTAQGLVVTSILQRSRINDDVVRSHAGQGIIARYTQIATQYVAQVKQTSIELERLNAAMAKGVTPVAAKFLETLNPILRSLSDFAEKNPKVTGGLTVAAIATLNPISLGLGAIALAWWASASTAAAMSAGVAGAVTTALASAGVVAAAEAGVAGTLAGALAAAPAVAAAEVGVGAMLVAALAVAAKGTAVAALALGLGALIGAAIAKVELDLAPAIRKWMNGSDSPEATAKAQNAANEAAIARGEPRPFPNQKPLSVLAHPSTMSPAGQYPAIPRGGLVMNPVFGSTPLGPTLRNHVGANPGAQLRQEMQHAAGNRVPVPAFIRDIANMIGLSIPGTGRSPVTQPSKFVGGRPMPDFTVPVKTEWKAVFPAGAPKQELHVTVTVKGDGAANTQVANQIGATLSKEITRAWQAAGVGGRNGAAPNVR